jgi:hypothetical protein
MGKIKQAKKAAVGSLQGNRGGLVRTGSFSDLLRTARITMQIECWENVPSFLSDSDRTKVLGIKGD